MITNVHMNKEKNQVFVMHQRACITDKVLIIIVERETVQPAQPIIVERENVQPAQPIILIFPHPTACNKTTSKSGVVAYDRSVTALPPNNHNSMSCLAIGMIYCGKTRRTRSRADMNTFHASL